MLSTIQRPRTRYQATGKVKWLTKNDDLTYMYLTLNVSTIFASTICVLAGYRQFRTNNRASRVICIQILIKIF